VRYDPAVSHRRSLRLSSYDYSQAGAYFVTVCTWNRELLLESKAVRDAVQVAWEALPPRFPDGALDAFVVMPNHVHGIIALQGRGIVGAQQAGAPTLGKVVRAFKSLSAIEANRILGRGGAFWQRNYYEHVMRDEKDLDRVRRYIQENPLKWAEDPDNPANW